MSQLKNIIRLFTDNVAILSGKKIARVSTQSQKHKQLGTCTFSMSIRDDSLSKLTLQSYLTKTFKRQEMLFPTAMYPLYIFATQNGSYFRILSAYSQLLTMAYSQLLIMGMT